MSLNEEKEKRVGDFGEFPMLGDLSHWGNIWRERKWKRGGGGFRVRTEIEGV